MVNVFHIFTIASVVVFLNMMRAFAPLTLLMKGMKWVSLHYSS